MLRTRLAPIEETIVSAIIKASAGLLRADVGSRATKVTCMMTLFELLDRTEVSGGQARDIADKLSDIPERLRHTGLSGEAEFVAKILDVLHKRDAHMAFGHEAKNLW